MGISASCGTENGHALITELDQYAMPHITDVTNCIDKARVFSKLDQL